MKTEGLARWKLLSPFLFLSLEFKERARYLAAAIAAGVAFAIACTFTQAPLMGPLGLLEDVKVFVTILFPFYVVALVSVATFDRKGLDDMPAGGQVRLARRNSVPRYLTRRQFLCSIFGYCSALSLLIFLLIIFAKVAEPWLVTTGILHLPYVRGICIAVIATMFAHMIIITFWGLYYLSDRLHT